MVTKSELSITINTINNLDIESLERLELIILNRKGFLLLENDYYEEAFKELNPGGGKRYLVHTKDKSFPTDNKDFKPHGETVMSVEDRFK